jgi:cell division protein FtsB
MKKSELQATIDLLTQENQQLRAKIAKLEKEAVHNDWR